MAPVASCGFVRSPISHAWKMDLKTWKTFSLANLVQWVLLTDSRRSFGWTFSPLIHKQETYAKRSASSSSRLKFRDGTMPLSFCTSKTLHVPCLVVWAIIHVSLARSRLLPESTVDTRTTPLDGVGLQRIGCETSQPLDVGIPDSCTTGFLSLTGRACDQERGPKLSDWSDIRVGRPGL